MKKTAFALLLATGLFACKNKNVPDVSNIKVNLTVQRFEQDFFAIDTNNIERSMQQLVPRYGGFLGDYVLNILGIAPMADSAMVSPELPLKHFLKDYQPIKDSADKLFRNFAPYEKEVKKGLQFVKYYFPAYHLPEKLITYIGPMDAAFEASLGKYGDVITQDGLAVGLQLHLGSNFSVYHSEMGQQLYPTYVSRRFAPEYIAVNCMKNIIDDIHPERIRGLNLVEQMVEKGKRLYALEKLLPYTEDSLLTGYTAKQLKGCIENEGNIWNFFLTNGLLYKNEPDLIKEYITDGPFTQALGQGSPGFIGMWVGRQIIRKYVEKHKSVTLQQILQTDPKKIFEESKYKPG
ncbi:hypothetical protein [Pseudobacter ginsenosidimutans]|uniref:Gliding motility-associated lipoprotein GldB n=1 Tax=Pseudobacter ginsenosidimutans TaxID=661488 RepID=A0A4Q7MW51_9BACT|nr:hypothetical protein [Pseudobacter ginsenosidimutans]RZS71270.1 hypothetical protein EV199_3172 [Pseudobacter ginsenosidimutans]